MASFSLTGSAARLPQQLLMILDGRGSSSVDAFLWETVDAAFLLPVQFGLLERLEMRFNHRLELLDQLEAALLVVFSPFARVETVFLSRHITG